MLRNSTIPRIGALTLLLLSSCREEEIRTYRVPSDDPPGQGALSDEAATPAATGRVTWQAPAEWEEDQPAPSPGARYRVQDSGQVSVTRLAGRAGGIVANVNRWRGQSGLPPLPEPELAEQAIAIPVGNATMKLFESYPAADDPAAVGNLGGILPLATETWFFKFTAPADLLRKHSDSFREFLRSVTIAPPSDGLATVPPSSPGEQARTKPTLDCSPPAGWEPSSGSAMRAASFHITGENGGGADVAVVPLPGDAGSPLENLNWWRRQLRLPPLETGQENDSGSSLEGKAGTFFIAHLVSEEALIDGKLMAAISAATIKKNGYTWFFKLTGDLETVRQNRDKFEAFVRSAAIP